MENLKSKNMKEKCQEVPKTGHKGTHCGPSTSADYKKSDSGMCDSKAGYSSKGECSSDKYKAYKNECDKNCK